MCSRPCLVILAVLTTLPVVVNAQQQDKTMEDRLLRPSAELQYSGFDKKAPIERSFLAGKTVSIQSFYLGNKFRSRDYLTGAYHGRQPFWMGDFRYESKASALAEKESTSRLAKEFSTREMATNEHREQGRASRYSERTSQLEGRTTKVEGRSQHRLLDTRNQAEHSVGWQGDLHQIDSIDDIRALLNKDADVRKKE